MTIQTIAALTTCLGLATPLSIDYSAPPPPAPKVVDLAICLDTSGSMSGLINAARQNIWTIVNDLALAKPTPQLRIALLTFGNNDHDKAAGWVAVQTPLTDDLDLVSQKLFALSTNGGDEYVGRVLQASLDQLAWSPDPGALKLIVVAGNEGADQDQEVDFRAMCRRAIGDGIMVNSIYCGSPADQLAPVWREVATLADGQFASIDQDNGTVVIETPFDVKLTELSAGLNETYLPYGPKGQWGVANQCEQDKNASGLNVAASAQRAMTKASSNYACSSWDLVDASKGEDFKLATVKVEDLPEAMRTMTPEQQVEHIAVMAAKRGEIQQQIADLTAKRDTFAREEMKKRALDTSKSFDFAMRQSIRAQAASKGFKVAGGEDNE